MLIKARQFPPTITGDERNLLVMLKSITRLITGFDKELPAVAKASPVFLVALLELICTCERIYLAKYPEMEDVTVAIDVSDTRDAIHIEERPTGPVQ